MTTAKVALSIPRDVLNEARNEVAKGRAESLSAFVSRALDEKLRRDELTTILDAMDARAGVPTEEEKAWARRVLKP